jgi:tetratricopeptide (TPR) repeat protein
LDPSVIFGAWWLNRQQERRHDELASTLRSLAPRVTPALYDWRESPAEKTDVDDYEEIEAASTEEALQLSSGALRRHPHSTLLLLQRASVLFDAGRGPEALGLWEDEAAHYARTTLKDSHANAMVQAAMSLMWLGRPNEALARADRALALNPSGTYGLQAHVVRAEALVALGSYDDALRALDSFERVREADGWTISVRVAALNGLGEESRAIEVAADWVASHPADAEAIGPAFAAALWSLISNRQADPTLIGSYRELFSTSDEVQAAVASWQMQAGLYGEALDTLESILDRNPRSSWAHLNRQYALAKLGRYQQSLEASERSLELAEADHAKAMALVNRGLALSRLGRKDDALEEYEAAMALEPEDPSVWYDRACVRCQLGRTAEALEDLRRAIELDPGRRESARHDADFDRLRQDQERAGAFEALLAGAG